VDVTATASDDGSEPLFVPGLLIDNSAYGEYSASLVADESDDTQLALHVPDAYAARGAVSGGATFWAEEHVYESVLFDGEVELNVGETFDLVAKDGTPYSGLAIMNLMGALSKTGLQFQVSDDFYPSFWLESINGISDQQPWSFNTYSWAAFINGGQTSNWIYDNTLADGDNVKFYYLKYEQVGQTFEPMVDQALYVVDIDIKVIGSGAPEAHFITDVTSGNVPLSVQFTDLSTNGPTSWSWDFENDGVVDSTEQNPTHTYSVPGVYTVSLMVSNAVSSDEEIKSGYIVVNEPVSPVTDFTYTTNGGAITISNYTGPGGSVIIPGEIDGLPVITVGDRAFKDCTTLNSVVIPDSITSIRYNAFDGCTNLTSVSIGSGVTSISNSAFYGCIALTSVSIPDSVTSIGSSVFEGCAALASVTIGNGVTSIGSYAFSYCISLTSVTMPDSISTIGKYAFRGCTALTSIVFMGNAPTVGNGWANGCTNLIIYYQQGATGFTTPTWKGVPCYPI